MSVKSQVASLITLESVATFLITSLYLTFGLISMLPFSNVGELKRAAEIYFPENSPAYVLVILTVVARIIYLF